MKHNKLGLIKQATTPSLTGEQLKPKLILFTIFCSMLLAAPAALAQSNLSANASSNVGANHSANLATNVSTPTSTVTNTQTWKPQRTSEDEQWLLPPGLIERLELTEAQRTELKPIENHFAKTSQEYRVANQPRIDAAQEANRQARESKSPGQIQIASNQLHQVWAGLQPYRTSAVTKIKPLLNPEQLKVLNEGLK